MAVAAEYMSKHVVAITPENSLANSRNIMLKKKIGRLVVVDSNDRFLGIVSRTDLALALRQGGPAWRRRPIDEILVKDVMKSQVPGTGSQTPINEVAAMMLKGGTEEVLIFEDEAIVGILTTHDLIKYLADKGDASMKIRDNFERDLAVASSTHSVNHIIKLLIRSPSRKVIVVDAERLPIGVITPSNLAFVKFDVGKSSYLRSKSGRNEPTHRKTAFLGVAQAVDVMSSPVYIARERDTVVAVSKTMIYRRIGGLPVLSAKSVLLGMFSKREVLKIVAKYMAA